MFQWFTNFPAFGACHHSLTAVLFLCIQAAWMALLSLFLGFPSLDFSQLRKMMPALAYNFIIVATNAWIGKWNRYAVARSDFFLHRCFFCKKEAKNENRLCRTEGKNESFLAITMKIYRFFSFSMTPSWTQISDCYVHMWYICYCYCIAKHSLGVQRYLRAKTLNNVHLCSFLQLLQKILVYSWCLGFCIPFPISRAQWEEWNVVKYFFQHVGKEKIKKRFYWIIMHLPLSTIAQPWAITWPRY